MYGTVFPLLDGRVRVLHAPPMEVLPLYYPDTLPEEGASAEEVDHFARSLNGYMYWGSDAEYERVLRSVEQLRAEDRLHDASPVELRTALFAKQRAAHHNGHSLEHFAVADLLDALFPHVWLPQGTARDPFALRAFRAICDGVERNEPLLANMVARVAPEYAVVASAVEGLRSHWSDERQSDSFSVQLEAAYGEVKKIDMLVSSTAEQEPLLIEFKVFWPNGVDECAAGVRKDRAKLSGCRGLAVVFGYAVHEAPAECNRSCTERRLADALEEARLGDPVFAGPHRAFEIRGVKGEYQLLAYSPEG